MINGIYEELVNNKLLKELNDENLFIGREKLDSEDAKIYLKQYIGEITERALNYLRNNFTDKESDKYINKQIEICNEIIELLKRNLNDNEFEDLKISDQAEVITYVYSKINNTNFKEHIIRPETSISHASLFTGANNEPKLSIEIGKEIYSADEIYLLISFIRWSGLREILPELKEFTDKGKKLKVITTSYMGATELKAIKELANLKNTEIKISYDVDRTRLHAKAYILKRNNNFTTAYIGSSNISKVAMTSGLEWNMKVSERESFEIIQKMMATFETYWNDSTFELFNNTEDDIRKLKSALENYNKKYNEDNQIAFSFNIKPYTYQQEILDNLEAERKIFKRYKNLVVAPTGVGKTIISAFDYKKFKMENENARILFIAHREEILKKSRDTFRVILNDMNFGELLVGKNKPEKIDNLFISIQSLKSSKLIERVTPDFYDYIVIDEVHHGAAESYQKVFEYFKPKVLLGLTATPDRMDGLDITEYFDKRIAFDMRLPEAIDNKLLSPFQYFGVSDSVDLSELKWTRGGYDVSDLENVYVFNEKIAKKRANEIIRNTIEYVNDIEKVKGLAFCASIKHADFMSKLFNDAGIKSISLTGNTDDEIRKKAISELEKGNIKFIFTVDLFNEGVDIPEVNTILFLRPTESLTIFLQQLGRGLRLSENKECLTVLDFIGESNKNYNFQEKFRALIGKTKKSVKSYVEDGFEVMPKGCYIRLEKQAKEYVLRNIKEFKNNNKNLTNKIEFFEGDIGQKLTLANFLKYYNIPLKEFYNGKRTFSGLLYEAKIIKEIDSKQEEFVKKRFQSLVEIDSPKFIYFIKEFLKNTSMELSVEQEILKNMLYYTFYSDKPTKLGLISESEGIEKLVKDRNLNEELNEVLDIMLENIDYVPNKNNYDFVSPLEVHSTYSQAQILAGIGYYKEDFYGPVTSGAQFIRDKNQDLFFITLNKSEKDFSDITRYEDYAISENLFHWQSSNKDTENSKEIQRYLNNNGRISLFVREYKKIKEKSCPYIYLGECYPISHEGNRPVNFVFKLKNDIPAKFLSEANKIIL